MADAAKSRSAALPAWPDEIYRVLKDAGVRQVAMVPDAGHSAMEPGIRKALVAATDRFCTLD